MDEELTEKKEDRADPSLEEDKPFDVQQLSSFYQKYRTWIITALVILLIIIFFSCKGESPIVKTEEIPLPEENMQNTSSVIEPAQEPTVQEEIKENKAISDFTSLKDAFEYNGAIHCSFMIDDLEMDIYKKDTSFRQDAKQKELSLSTLYKGDLIYTWTNTNLGKKLDLKRLARSGIMEKIPEDPRTPSDQMINKATNLQCDTLFPTTIFEPPTYISFRDMNDELEKAYNNSQLEASRPVGYSPTIDQLIIKFYFFVKIYSFFEFDRSPSIFNKRCF